MECICHGKTCAMTKKIVFLSGTRADFGKLKSLISITQSDSNYEVHIFVTGMHMQRKFGRTIDEIYNAGFTNIYPFMNQDLPENMDRTLAKTINGFSHFCSEIQPDLIVVHGDRVEALAGAIVGSLNNILVSHIEGGEVSGTIDELIRHAVSKLAHVHFVANHEAKERLMQLGEHIDSVHIIGSPDLDIIKNGTLPTIEDAKARYDICFDEYAIAMFHPVTTEYGKIKEYASEFVKAILSSSANYIVIYPNNDLGSTEILEAYAEFDDLERIKVFPSLRFEYFLSLLKAAKFIIGNSSAGIREAPSLSVPTIDIGTRQMNRASIDSVINVGYESEQILAGIRRLLDSDLHYHIYDEDTFGSGRSDIEFMGHLNNPQFFSTSKQKQLQRYRGKC